MAALLKKIAVFLVLTDNEKKVPTIVIKKIEKIEITLPTVLVTKDGLRIFFVYFLIVQSSMLPLRLTHRIYRSKAISYSE